jgi:transcription elongation factor Elf1
LAVWREDAITSELVLESTLTCPPCGHNEIEQTATNSCQWFYECRNCWRFKNESAEMKLDIDLTEAGLIDLNHRNVERLKFFESAS